jgi:hypothetical protein
MAAPNLVITLTRRYSRLLGEFLRAEAQCEAARIQMEHIAATIAMFDDRWDAAAVKPTRPVARLTNLKHGQASRMAIGVLREAAGPMTTMEIAMLVIERCDKPPTGRNAAARLANTITATLKKKIGKTVATDNGRPRRWWIQPLE